MDQTFHALLERGERAETCDVGDPARHPFAGNVPLGDGQPRIGLQPLEAERDAALFAVDADHFHFHFLADGHEISGVVHAPPRNFREVHQAFHPAQVDEHAEAGDVGHLALDAIAHLDLRQQLRAAAGRGLGRAFGEHHPPLLRIELDDLGAHRLADFAVHHRLALLVAGEGRNADEVRERDEPADVIALHEQSAAVDAGDREFGDAVAFVQLARRRPVVGGLIAFVRRGFLRRRATIGGFFRENRRPPGFTGLVGRGRVARGPGFRRPRRARSGRRRGWSGRRRGRSVGRGRRRGRRGRARRIPRNGIQMFGGKGVQVFHVLSILDRFFCCSS